MLAMHEPPHYDTPTMALIDHRLRGEVGEGLYDAIWRLRIDQGLSWRLIAEHLQRWTGQDVTYETVRRWSLDWGIEPDGQATEQPKDVA